MLQASQLNKGSPKRRYRPRSTHSCGSIQSRIAEPDEFFKDAANHPGDQRSWLFATAATVATAFNWSNSVRTFCQRTVSFFVSIAAEGSE